MHFDFKISLNLCNISNADQFKLDLKVFMTESITTKDPIEKDASGEHFDWGEIQRQEGMQKGMQKGMQTERTLALKAIDEMNIPEEFKQEFRRRLDETEAEILAKDTKN